MIFEGIDEAIACDEFDRDDRGEPVDWIIHEVNAAYEKTFCVEREQVVGRRAETVQGELLVLYSPEGHQQWLSASVAPVYTPDGRLLGAVGTAADVSKVYELQREKEVYLHTISHDLRTPLTVIEGRAQLLEARMAEGDFDPSESIADPHRLERILRGARDRGLTPKICRTSPIVFTPSGGATGKGSD